MPDISVDESDISPIARHLYSNMVIFDFATNYAAKNTKVNSAESFTISDANFDEFIDFTLSKKISFKTATEKHLDEFIKTAKSEKYFKKVEAEINALKTGLIHNVKDDILYFKDDIKRLLETEITKRYYYRKGAILNSLKNGKSIDKAIEIMKNKDKYNSLLKPK